MFYHILVFFLLSPLQNYCERVGANISLPYCIPVSPSDDADLYQEELTPFFTAFIKFSFFLHSMIVLKRFRVYILLLYFINFTPLHNAAHYRPPFMSFSVIFFLSLININPPLRNTPAVSGSHLPRPFPCIVK